MIARTDNYYDEVGNKPPDAAIQTVKDALKYACERHHMRERDISTRAWILVWRKDGNDDGGMY